MNGWFAATFSQPSDRPIEEGQVPHTVLVELRRDPVLAPTPVIMLTARTQSSDRRAAVAAGANRFVAKPFSPLELVSTVEELLADRP